MQANKRNKERMKRNEEKKKGESVDEVRDIDKREKSVDERLKRDKRMSEVKIFDEVKRIATLSGWHRKCFATAPPRVLVLSFTLS